MTLNGVIALILRYFTEFGASWARCVKVVEDVVVKKFMFAISSPYKFLVTFVSTVLHLGHLLLQLFVAFVAG